MICLITGGERSGKSNYAQRRPLSSSVRPVYLATAKRWDQDFENRIGRHQSERNNRSINIEEENLIAKPIEGHLILPDCVTLWLSNIFSEFKGNVDEPLAFSKEELAKAFNRDVNWIVVTNEIGMGVHATNETGRKFVELQGWVNQYIAERANEVFLNGLANSTIG
jgi:adenosylcobinamide kinase/adenosylcobinamide-phosphate guanylyltransferase